MKFLITCLFLLSHSVFAGWSVSTFNIRNFDHDRDAGPTNIAELKKLIKETKSDVMAFQEVVNAPAFDAVITAVLPGYKIIKSSCGGFGKQNLALVYDQAKFDFIKMEEDLSYTGKENACGSLRPVMLVTLKQKSTGVEHTFAVVHLKAGGDSRAMETRWVQYNKLKSLYAKHMMKNIIMLGDFNTTGYNQGNTDFAKFEELLQSSSLRSSAENIGCTNYWHGGDQDPALAPSTLDHIVMQDKLHKSISQVRLGSHCQKAGCRPALPGDLGTTYTMVSDHCPVQVTFK